MGRCLGVREVPWGEDKLLASHETSASCKDLGAPHGAKRRRGPRGPSAGTTQPAVPSLLGTGLSLPNQPRE